MEVGQAASANGTAIVSSTQKGSAQGKQPAPQQQTKEQKDEYVPAASTVLRDALYDVSNIKGRRSGGMLSTSMSDIVTSSNEVEAAKVVDIVLALGLKSLKVFYSKSETGRMTLVK